MSGERIAYRGHLDAMVAQAGQHSLCLPLDPKTLEGLGLDATAIVSLETMDCARHDYSVLYHHRVRLVLDLDNPVRHTVCMTDTLWASLPTIEEWFFGLPEAGTEPAPVPADAPPGCDTDENALPVPEPAS